ncbi:MAG: tRNA (adenosine(37)-N6)-threonylcarbamoyltransferase complex dimerization subunit type 1 TsaB [Luteolibacter sp.]
MSDCFSLIFETSTPMASLATVEPCGRIVQREFTSDRSHNAVLFSPLRELLEARQSPRIGRVLVGSGPGSYSGTRVGIAAAQGVAIACGCPAVAVPSILAVPSAMNGAACLAIGDARRGSFWTARVEHSDTPQEPELTDANGLATALLAAREEGIPVISFEHPERFPLEEGLKQRVRLEFPTAERLWQAWLAASPEARGRWMSHPPQPIYLKPPHITPAKRSWLVGPQL